MLSFITFAIYKRTTTIGLNSMEEIDDLFNPELLEHLDEFDDEFDDEGDGLSIDNPNEIVNADKSQAEHQKQIAIIGIIIFMVIIVIISALILNK